MAKILLLEPDTRLSETISLTLRNAGHTCIPVRTFTEALGHVVSSEELLTVLDTKLPYAEALELLTALRQRCTPILFLSHTENNGDHLKALYRRNCIVLPSPFDDRALLNAVERLIMTADRQIVLGDLQMNYDRREVTYKGRVLELTTQEFELLRALMQSPENALSRESLLKTAWGYQYIGETRTVDVHVQRLRRKLGASWIETVYKTGYRLHVA